MLNIPEGIIERLNDDIAQLTSMVNQAAFAGAETGVRVKSPNILLKDLCDAVDAIRAISSLDHSSDARNMVQDHIADAGKLVEADGWSVTPPKYHRYPYFVEHSAGEWYLRMHHGNGASHTISVHATIDEAIAAAPSGEPV